MNLTGYSEVRGLSPRAAQVRVGTNINQSSWTSHKTGSVETRRGPEANTSEVSDTRRTWEEQETGHRLK